jgi:hypothetical protein
VPFISRTYGWRPPFCHVAISGVTVLIAGFIGSERFDMISLRRVRDDIAAAGDPALVVEAAE